MTYQDIVTLIAIKAALAPSSARLVAKHYYHCGVLRKDAWRGYTWTNERYMEAGAITRALSVASANAAARKEVTE